MRYLWRARLGPSLQAEMRELRVHPGLLRSLMSRPGQVPFPSGSQNPLSRRSPLHVPWRRLPAGAWAAGLARGEWPVRRVLIALGIMLTSLAIACGGGEPASDESTPMPGLSAEEVIDKAGEAMADLDSFRFYLSHERGNTVLPGGITLSEADGIVVNPDRMRVTAKTVFGSGFVKIDAVVIGDRTYMTNPLTGKWNRLSSDESPLAVLDPAGLIADILDQVASQEFDQDGGDLAGGYLLTGTVPPGALRSLVGPADTEEPLRYRVTIDSSTFHLQEVRLTGRIKNDESEDTLRTIELSAFDEAGLVEPPA